MKEQHEKAGRFLGIGVPPPSYSIRSDPKSTSGAAQAIFMLSLRDVGRGFSCTGGVLIDVTSTEPAAADGNSSGFDGIIESRSARVSARSFALDPLLSQSPFPLPRSQ